MVARIATGTSTAEKVPWIAPVNEKIDNSIKTHYIATCSNRSMAAFKLYSHSRSSSLSADKRPTQLKRHALLNFCYVNPAQKLPYIDLRK